MKKKIMIGTIRDPVMDCVAAMFEYDDPDDLQEELLKFEDKRVRITIEEL